MLACAALKCVGGQFQGRLVFRNDDERARAERLGLTDFDRKYTLHELVRADAIFAATGVTTRRAAGRRALRQAASSRTDTLVMNSASRTVREVRMKRPALMACQPSPGADRAATAAFLGVDRSLSGRAWRMRPADPALVTAHQRALDLPEPLARALASRGVAAEDGERIIFRPTLKALFPDPSSFLDMDRAAAAILVDALEARPPDLWSSPTTTWTAPPAPPCWCAGSAPWARSCRSTCPTA